MRSRMKDIYCRPITLSVEVAVQLVVCLFFFFFGIMSYASREAVSAAILPVLLRRHHGCLTVNADLLFSQAETCGAAFTTAGSGRLRIEV